MKCAHCGSKDVLEQPYSIFCRRCGMETSLVRRSKLADVSAVDSLANAAKESRSLFRRYIYILFALMFIAGFIVARITS